MMTTDNFEQNIERSKAALAAFIPPEGIPEIDLEKNQQERAQFIAKAEKVLFVAIAGMFAFGWMQFGF